MATKTLGNGIVLKYDEDGDTLSHTAIGEIVNIELPAQTCDDIDVTDLDSTIVEYLPSDVDDMGEVSFTQLWHAGDTVHEHIDTAFANRSTANTYQWQIVYPYSTPVTDQFTGYVKSKGGESAGPRDSIKRRVTIKLTSAITRT